jgi:hypothetical protein
MPGMGYDGANYVFVDQMKMGQWFWLDTTTGFQPTVDSNNWPTLSAGQQIHRPLLYANLPDMDDVVGYFPPGSYKCVIDNTNITMSITSNAYISNVNTSTPGTMTFDVADASGHWSSLAIDLVFTNSTGSNQKIAYAYCCLASEESLLGGGMPPAKPYAFHPAYMAMIQGTNCLRIHDMYWLDNKWPQWAEHFTDFNPSQDPKLSNYSMAVESSNNWGIPGIPMAVTAHLCKEAGAAGWYNAPLGTGQSYVFIKGSTSQFQPVGIDTTTLGQPSVSRYANGTPVMFFTFGGNTTFTNKLLPAVAGSGGISTAVRYYVVNNNGTYFQISATLGGAPITLTDNTDSMPAANNFGYMCPLDLDIYNNMLLPMAQALYAAEPSLHVYGEFSNEVWNAGFPGVEGCQWPLAWLSDPTNASGNQGQGRFGLAYGAIRWWHALDSVFGAAQVTALIGGQLGNPAPLDCFDYVEADSTFNPGGLTLKQILINRLAAHPTLPGAGYYIAPYNTCGSSTIKAHMTNGSAVMTNVQNWDNAQVAIAATAWTISDEQNGTGWSGNTVSWDSPTQVTTNTAWTGATGNYFLSWNGEQIHGAVVANGDTGSVSTTYWNNAIKNGWAQIYYTIGLSMTYAQARVPGIPLCIYEWGTVISGASFGSPYSAHDQAAWRQYCQYLQTSNARDSIKYFWDNAIAPYTPAVANYYRAPGSYYNDGGSHLFTFAISLQNSESYLNKWYKTV